MRGICDSVVFDLLNAMEDFHHFSLLYHCLSTFRRKPARYLWFLGLFELLLERLIEKFAFIIGWKLYKTNLVKTRNQYFQSLIIFSLSIKCSRKPSIFSFY